MSLIREAQQMLSLELTESKRWYTPFPMGVFGTLRDGQGNNRRMRRYDVALHRKAFLPNFFAIGLSINFKQGASAPFEVFFYKPDDWNLMIPGVDALEGFRPETAHRSQYGYYRTLAWLRLLPDDFKHTLFTDVNLGIKRDLCIPEEEWDQYEQVPCWVYSSRHQNNLANGYPVIWG